MSRYSVVRNCRGRLRAYRNGWPCWWAWLPVLWCRAWHRPRFGVARLYGLPSAGRYLWWPVSCSKRDCDCSYEIRTPNTPQWRSPFKRDRSAPNYWHRRLPDGRYEHVEWGGIEHRWRHSLSPLPGATPSLVADADGELHSLAHIEEREVQR